MYAFGIVLWELITSSPPFAHHTSLETFVHAVCTRVLFDKKEFYLHSRGIRWRGRWCRTGSSRLSRILCSAAGSTTLASGPFSQNSILLWKMYSLNPHRPTFVEILTELDAVLIAVAIADPLTRFFWSLSLHSGVILAYSTFRKHYYPHDTHAAWPDFMARYSAALKEPSEPTVAAFAELNLHYSELSAQRVYLNRACFKALLFPEGSEEGEARVSIERLGEVLDWFGPAERPDLAQPNNMLFDRIRLTLAQPYSPLIPCDLLVRQ